MAQIEERVGGGTRERERERGAKRIDDDGERRKRGDGPEEREKMWE